MNNYMTTVVRAGHSDNVPSYWSKLFKDALGEITHK